MKLPSDNNMIIQKLTKPRTNGLSVGTHVQCASRLVSTLQQHELF